MDKLLGIARGHDFHHLVAAEQIAVACTIQDLLLLMEKASVFAFPVLDEHVKRVGIVL